MTTATDVYSLGVLLHELLTGRRPFDWGERSLYEILTELERSPPLPPSRMIQATVASPEAAAAAWARRTSVESLRRQLRGDLDHVVLEALRFEPEKRYATVAELQEDVRRYLDGRPVSARASTWAYRTGRLVRRHSLAVVNVLAIAGLLIWLTVASTLDARRLARERDAVAHAKARADRVAGFLVDLLGVADPRSDVEASITAQEILQRGAERVRRELRDQPELRAELSHTIGVLCASRGLFEDAERLLTEALALKRELELAPSAIAETLAALASLDSELGRTAEAERRARRAHDLRRTSLPPHDPAIGASLRQLAQLNASAGRHDEALAYLVDLTALDRQRDAKDELAADLLSLAQVRYYAGDLSEAEAAAREGLELLALLDAPAADRASGLNTLGATLWKGWRLEEAEAPYREALELYRSAYGEDHPKVAVTYNNLANLLFWLGDGAQAITLLNRAIDVNRKAYGDRHPTVFLGLQNLANVARSSGRLDEAEKIHRDVLEALLEQLGPDHPRVVVALYSLGSTLFLERRYGEAENYLETAFERGRKVFTPSHPDQLTIGATIARLRHRQGRLAAAEQGYREFLARMGETDSGEATPGMANGRYGLAEVLVDSGRAAEALAPAQQAVDRLRTELPDGHHMLLEAESVLGYVLARLGRVSEARTLLEESCERLLASQGSESDRTVSARRRLASLDE
jgi:serine/threonine-protein kinase